MRENTEKKKDKWKTDDKREKRRREEKKKIGEGEYKGRKRTKTYEEKGKKEK